MQEDHIVIGLDSLVDTALQAIFGNFAKKNIQLSPTIIIENVKIRRSKLNPKDHEGLIQSL